MTILENTHPGAHRTQQFLRRDDVVALTGVPVSTIYQLMSQGAFPRPVRISPRLVAWLESDIAAWQRSRIAERDGQAA